MKKLTIAGALFFATVLFSTPLSAKSVKGSTTASKKTTPKQTTSSSNRSSSADNSDNYSLPVSFKAADSVQEKIDIYVNGLIAATIDQKNKEQKVSVKRGTFTVYGLAANSKKQKYSVDNNRGRGGTITVSIIENGGVKTIQFKTDSKYLTVTQEK